MSVVTSTLFFLCLFVDLRDEVINLALHRPHRNLRVEQAGRTDDLLGAQQLMFRLVGAGRCGDKEHLVDTLLELLKGERPVVHRRREPESVFDQRLLAALIAVIHCSDLRNRNVRLVDHDHVVALEKVHETHRGRARRAPGERPRIVLDAAAEAGLAEHFNVKIRALGDSLGFEKFSLTPEVLDPLLQLLLNLIAGAVDLLLRHDIVRGRENIYMPEFSVRLSRNRLDLRDAVYLIAEKLNAENIVRAFGRIDLEHIAVQAVAAALQVVIALIVDIRETVADFLRALLHAGAERDCHLFVVIRRTEAVDTGNRGDDDDISSFRQEAVADRRILSISSFTAESFAI